MKFRLILSFLIHSKASLNLRLKTTKPDNTQEMMFKLQGDWFQSCILWWKKIKLTCPTTSWAEPTPELDDEPFPGSHEASGQTNQNMSESSGLWIDKTFRTVLSTSQIDQKITVTDNQRQSSCGFYWQHRDWPAGSPWCLVGQQWRSWTLSPPAAVSHRSDLHLRPKPPAGLQGRRSFNTAVSQHVPTHIFNSCVSVLPLTLSMLSWRQRKVWECVVMRRKSLQTAKEEMLEASWKRDPSTTYFPSALSLHVQAEELLNDCDRIPLCLQRTGGICPSGPADVPEDRRVENMNL